MKREEFSLSTSSNEIAIDCAAYQQNGEWDLLQSSIKTNDEHTIEIELIGLGGRNEIATQLIGKRFLELSPRFRRDNIVVLGRFFEGKFPVSGYNFKDRFGKVLF